MFVHILLGAPWPSNPSGSGYGFGAHSRYEAGDRQERLPARDFRADPFVSTEEQWRGSEQRSGGPLFSGEGGGAHRPSPHTSGKSGWDSQPSLHARGASFGSDSFPSDDRRDGGFSAPSASVGGVEGGYPHDHRSLGVDSPAFAHFSDHSSYGYDWGRGESSGIDPRPSSFGRGGPTAGFDSPHSAYSDPYGASRPNRRSGRRGRAVTVSPNDPAGAIANCSRLRLSSPFLISPLSCVAQFYIFCSTILICGRCLTFPPFLLFVADTTFPKDFEVASSLLVYQHWLPTQFSSFILYFRSDAGV